MQYDRGGNHNYNSGAPYNRQGPPRKRSGCKLKTDKNGNRCIVGWNKSKSRGFVTFIASPHKDKAKRLPKKGNSEVWMVKMTQGINVVWHVGLYTPDTKKLKIPDLNMVANPNASNGGYFGTFLKK